MTVVTETTVLDEKDLGVLMQATVEAYKTFEKLAENLPNPLTAQMFKAFAVDERETRDLLDGKIAAINGTRVRLTLPPPSSALCCTSMTIRMTQNCSGQRLGALWRNLTCRTSRMAKKQWLI